MQDEVSETENIRRNLSIERQFAEGCEELLDVEQIFIRQGTSTIFHFVVYLRSQIFVHKAMWLASACTFQRLFH